MDFDILTHIGGGGAIAVLLTREVLRFINDRRKTKPAVNGTHRALNTLSMESFETSMRHLVRNEMMPALGKISEMNMGLAERIDESNTRLESINNTIIRLPTIIETRR